MKRFISLLTVCLMLISMCVFSTVTVFASEGDFTYKEVDGGVEITAYTGFIQVEKDENEQLIPVYLNIPETLGGSPVVGIGDKAFYQNKSRVFVVLPEGIEYIGNRAFAGSHIRGIEMSDSVKTLGDSAFNGCIYLETLTLSKGIKTISNSCFHDCTRLEEIVVPEGVEVIEDMAFQTVNHLTSLTLPSTLKSIGEYAFAYMGISEIIIPEGVEELADFSFFMCPNLKKVTIPDTVKTIGECAFRSCPLLSTLSLGEGVETIKTGAFESCALTNVSIPASVTEIGDYAIGYAWDDGLWDYVLVEDFEIICVEGTAGYEYASANGITYTATPSEGPTEEPTEAPTQAPTEAPTQEPTEAPTNAPTVAPTAEPTEAPTNAPTVAPTAEPTDAPTNAPTVVPTNAPTQTPTEEPPTAPKFEKGDANTDGNVNIKDATAIQKHVAELTKLSVEGMILAEYDGDTKITVKDATAIQKFIAGIVF